MTNTTSDIKQQILEIIKAPSRSTISTADIAVGCWSSTMLSEKLNDLTKLFESKIAAAETAARLDELKRLYSPDNGIMASHYIYLTDGAADEISKELKDRISQLERGE